MIGLTLDSIKGILPVLKKQSFDEPVPDFSEVDIGKLTSALKTPFLRKHSSHEILHIAAHIFCLLIESHSLPNANKRMAVVALFNFLRVNGYEIFASNVRLYAVAMAVTWLSKYQLFDKAIDEVFNFLKEETKKSPMVIPKEQLDELEQEFVTFMGQKK